MCPLRELISKNDQLDVAFLWESGETVPTLAFQ